MTSTISFIIPAYNAAPYLEQCLNSIMALDMKGWEREIIAVDDGSTDNTLQILQDYAENYKKVIVITQKNSGQGAARNKAIALAKGEYLCFVDADDCLSPRATLPFDAMEKGIDMIHIGMARIQKDGSKHAYHSRTHSNFMGAAWAYLIRRKLLTNNNIVFPEGIYHEDEEFCTKAWAMAQSHIESAGEFYLYYERPNSTCTSDLEDRKKKRILDRCTMMEHLVIFLNDNPQFRSKVQTKMDFLTLDLLINLRKGHFEPTFCHNIENKAKELGLLPLPWRWNLHYNFIRLKLRK